MSSLYHRKPKYLSPSSLVALEYDPIRFFLDRCGPEHLRPAKFQQTEPMAAGSAFDAMIKYYLRHATGDQILDDYLDKQVNRMDGYALWEGVRAFRAYIGSPAARMLVKADGLVRVDPTVEVRHVSANEALGSVPIWGIPDAEAFSDCSLVVDWKLTGAISGKGNMSPGYTRRWYHDGYGWRDRGAHHRCMEPLETLNERWATQVCMYGWMLGYQPGTPFKAAIDEIVMVGPMDEPLAVEIAQFRSLISPAFQRQVLQRLHKAWSMIINERLLPEGTTEEDLFVLAMTS